MLGEMRGLVGMYGTVGTRYSNWTGWSLFWGHFVMAKILRVVFPLACEALLKETSTNESKDF